MNIKWKTEPAISTFKAVDVYITARFESLMLAKPLPMNEKQDSMSDMQRLASVLLNTVDFGLRSRWMSWDALRMRPTAPTSTDTTSANEKSSFS